MSSMKFGIIHGGVLTYHESFLIMLMLYMLGISNAESYLWCDFSYSIIGAGG